MKYKMLSNEQLKYIEKNIYYDSESGMFTWINSTSNRVKIGDVAGSLSSSNGYRYIGVCGKHIAEHRLAWVLYYKEQPKGEIDHIDGNRTNNRIENLRLVTPQQNSTNVKMHKDNKLKLKGVHLHTDGRYRSQICHKGKRIHIGLFDNKFDAYNAYIEYSKKLNKQFHKEI